MTTVLVVGAGPTGLALAAQLRSFGAAVRIVEQRVDEQPSRAFVVQPRTLEVLAPGGTTASLVERGNPSARLVLHAGRQEATVAMATTGTNPFHPYPFLLAMPQTEVEAVLAEHLAEQGVAVERGVRLARLQPTGEAVTCELARGDGSVEHLDVPWVVGCDGRDSLVRHQASIGFPGRRYRQRLLLADVELDTTLGRDAVHGLLGPQGAVFLFPYSGERWWRLLSVLDADTDSDAARDPATVAERVLDTVSAGRARVTTVRWVAPVELRRAQADTYRRGRILLAGDAAHVHSPAGAQGMNTGLQDAVNLGWKLALVATGVADSRLLDTYQSERWPVARWTRRLTDVAFLFEVGDIGPLSWLRSHLAPALLPLVNGRSMPGWGFRLLGGLSTGYGPSPAAEEGSPAFRGGARAGRPMPDGELMVDGRLATIHDLLLAPGFHLFHFTDGAPPPPHDPAGRIPVYVHGVGLTPTNARPGGAALLRRLGVRGPATYLVRPDGHVGYRAACVAPVDVDRHLHRLLSGDS